MKSLNSYNLICSLGANCSATFQIVYRKMRKYALPFDWTSMKEDECLYKMAEGFKNNFKDYMLRENLIKLEKKEHSEAHSDKVQFKDIYTKLYYYNHFEKDLDTDNEYEKVKNKFDKRVKRFLYKIKNAEKILFVLSSAVNFSTDAIYNLVDTLELLYPNKKINIHIKLFNQKENKIVSYKSCNIYYYQRSENLYDYTETNFEWSFLDNVRVAEKRDSSVIRFVKNILSISKIKKGFSIVLLKRLNTVLYLKLYILGLRIQISIGRLKNE